MPAYSPMPEPWEPAVATRAINHLANRMETRLVMKRHATEREDLRDIIMSDVLYVLKTGFVYRDPEEATRQGFYKYLIEGRSPNSGNRALRICLIPDEKNAGIKVLTVMWVD